jgi:pSer/pThr/pTyr-binding forkhead associated (FHA) protein
MKKIIILLFLLLSLQAKAQYDYFSADTAKVKQLKDSTVIENAYLQKFYFGMSAPGNSLFFDNFLIYPHHYRRLQSFYEDSTWASGYKKALRLIGTAPGFYMLDTSTSKVAGFVFSNGAWSFRIGATATSLGTEWLNVQTGQLSLKLPLYINSTSGNGTSDYFQVNGGISPVTNNTDFLGNVNYRWLALLTNGIATKIDSVTANDVNITVGRYTMRMKTAGWDRIATLMVSGNPNGSIYTVVKSDDTTGRVLVKVENGGLINNQTIDIITTYGETHTYQQNGNNFILLNSYQPYVQNKPLLSTNYKIARIGTSLTADGDVGLSYGGLLGQLLTNYLYKTIASFVGPNDVTVSGANYFISNIKLLDNSALKIRGLNASVKCNLYGDEITLITAKERNNVGASIIDMYVDGSLYDSFTNYNDEPSGTLNFTATGNGTQTKFSLGRKFCYNPRSLTVGGISKTVIHQTSNSNISNYNFAGNDAMIVRKYQKVNGQPVVNDYLWFATAPSNGASIAMTVDYGENICFTQGTVTEIKDSLYSALEANYGDVLLDSTASTLYVDNLSFRNTDDRSIITWKFNTYKSRNIEFKIRKLDPRATGTPYFIFNGATNRFQKIMNAGISGYRAYSLAFSDATADLRTYVPIQDYKPDIALLEHGANDMTDPVFNTYIATRDTSGVSEQTVRDYPTRWIKSVTFQNPTYTISTAALKILSVTKNTVTINNTNVAYDSLPKAGDLLTIGTYHIDNREITTRVIDSWDNSTKTATFKKPLTKDEILGLSSLDNLAGQDVKIYRPVAYEGSMNYIIDRLKETNPNISMALVSTILQNEYIRTAYSEKINQIAFNKNLYFGNIYEELKKFQYSQTRNTQVYLTTANDTTADGSSSYTLVTGAGSEPLDVNQMKYWTVKVNGVERYGTNCYIEGGSRGSMGNVISAGSLVTASYAAAIAKYSNSITTTKLYFTANVPSNGDTVIVKYAPITTTDDNTHPNLTYGVPLYYNVYRKLLETIFYSKKDL